MTRHELLQGSIGTYPEEDDAYTLVKSLLWALPLIILTATFADLGFNYYYMKKTHPWKDILKDDQKKVLKKTKKKENILKREQSKLKNVIQRHFPSDFI